MKELIEKNWKWLTLLCSILGVGFTVGVWFKNQNIIMEELRKTSYQALIYSNAPLVQRTEKCDEYLSEGYDSYTKDYCLKLIEKAEIANLEVKNDI